jgi:hypothetical protein
MPITGQFLWGKTMKTTHPGTAGFRGSTSAIGSTIAEDSSSFAVSA